MSKWVVRCSVQAVTRTSGRTGCERLALKECAPLAPPRHHASCALSPSLCRHTKPTLPRPDVYMRVPLLNARAEPPKKEKKSWLHRLRTGHGMHMHMHVQGLLVSSGSTTSGASGRSSSSSDILSSCIVSWEDTEGSGEPPAAKTRGTPSVCYTTKRQHCLWQVQPRIQGQGSDGWGWGWGCGMCPRSTTVRGAVREPRAPQITGCSVTRADSHRLYRPRRAKEGFFSSPHLQGGQKELAR